MVNPGFHSSNAAAGSTARAMVAALVLLLTALSAGVSAGPKVKRVDAADQSLNVSGRWNAADLVGTVHTMVEQCLGDPWLRNWQAEHPDRMPVVTVGSIVRDVIDHGIQTRPIVEEIERSLINSGQVGFVAEAGRRDELRDEVTHQERRAAEETVSRAGRAIGADFMLTGAVHELVDAAGRKKDRYVQVNLELIHIESQMKVWVGSEKIRKLVKGKRWRP